MDEKRLKKTKVQIIFSILVFTIAFFMEMYAMINEKDNYILISVIGVIALATLFIVVDGIIELYFYKNDRREEQYQNIFKSEKASYLLQKKYFEQIEDQLVRVEKAAIVPTEEIVNAQKGIAKVIINRSRENAEALMTSNDILLERFDDFQKAVKSHNEEILSKDIANQAENTTQLKAKQQEVMLSLKDMELRLNTAIMQTQQMISSQSVPQIIQQPIMQPQMAPIVQEATVAEEAILEEKQQESTPEIEVTDSNKKLGEDEIAALFSSLGGDTTESTEESKTEEVIKEVEEIVAEEAIKEVEETVAEEVIPEEKQQESTPEMELTDSNKKLGEDEIAALFASLGGDTAEPTEEPKAEEVIKEVEVPDPNKKLSPDEIAALFSSIGTGNEEEPAPTTGPEPVEEEPEKVPASEVDLSDPNKKLSPDEIAALFASMG